MVPLLLLAAFGLAAAAQLQVPAAAQDEKPGPLLVFILAGQSNMEGQAQVGGLGLPDCPLPDKRAACNRNGSLAWLVKHNPDEFGFAATNGGKNWTVRDDVWMWTNENGKVDANTSSQGSFGGLSAGYGCFGGGPEAGHQMGPEYGFGFTLGDKLKQQVLLIKTAWGGKTLAVDFRSPSAAKKSGAVGYYWTRMLSDVKLALGSIETLFPKYDKAAGYKVAGLLWDQGWNDGCSESMSHDYEANLVDFIQDART